MNRKFAKTTMGFALAVLASSCSLPDRVEQSLDPVETMHTELMGEGIDEPVADCIIRLGQREIERAELSDVALDELQVVCERLLDSSSTGDSDETEGETIDINRPLTNGDNDELDRLWVECENGTGASCDELFDESPVGSEYELFGVSCGERDDILNCSELDEPEVDEEPVPQVYRDWQESQSVTPD